MATTVLAKQDTLEQTVILILTSVPPIHVLMALVLIYS